MKLTTGNALLALQLLSAVLVLQLLFACQSPPSADEAPSPARLSFTESMITDSAQFWWAHCPAEITGDGIADLVFIHNNASGGYLAYYEGRVDTGLWTRHIIADTPPTGGLFAAGDLECADMDFDGDIDVFAVKHPGEWTDAGASAELFWYENPSWKVHRIGQVPDAVKDVNFGDFDGDQKMDLAVLTFDENTLSIFRQESADEWERVQYFEKYRNLHEGMAIGDIDGDQDVDIVANALVFYNPGGNLKGDWTVEALDDKWNTQEGDWSRNGTKIFTQNIDQDEEMEVFVSHSERAGYPLAWYEKKNGQWQEHIIHDSIPACHTLQVYDFDLDGDMDVLAGINRNRAVNLDIDHFEVYLFLNAGDNRSWEPQIIGEEGIYNGQAVDFEGDGDIDIFRYPNHEATEFFLWKNDLK